MYRSFFAQGEKKLSSVTFTSLFSYIAMHVEFRQTCLYKVAEQLDIAVEQVVLPQSVQSWFHEQLENFDTSTAVIECCIQL